MRKTLLLARVLRKCSSTGESRSSVREEQIIAAVLAVIFAFCMAGAGWLTGLADSTAKAISAAGGETAENAAESTEIILSEQLSAPSSDAERSDKPEPAFAETVFSLIYMVTALIMIITAVPGLISLLYMSDDLHVLFSMPFSSTQIVAARMLNCLLYRLLASACTVIPLGAGYIIAAGIPGAAFIPGMLLALLVLPPVAVAISGAVTILIMTLFRGIRSKDNRVVIGVIATLVLIIGVNLLSSRNSLSVTEESVKGFVSSIQGLSWIIPAAPFAARFQFGEGLMYLLYTVLVTLGLAGVFCLLEKALYLKGALQMINGSAKTSAMKADTIERSSHGSRLHTALVKKELRSVLREPAYMLNGWLMSFLWPLLMLLPMLMGEGDSASFWTGMLPRLTLSSAVSAFFIALLPAFFAVGFSNIAQHSISREGRSVQIMKQLPIRYSEQVRAKRDAAFVINLIPGAVYTLIIAIVLKIILPNGIITEEEGTVLTYPLLLIPFAAIADALCVFILDNIMVSHGLKKPDLNWESAAVLSKKNGFGLIVFFIGLICCFVFSLLGTMLPALPILLGIGADKPSAPSVHPLSALLMLALEAFIAFLTDKSLAKRANKYISRL